MSKLPLFDLGQLVITPGGQNLDQNSVLQALHRYVNGDWGDICAQDKQANDEALVFNNRILAAYKNIDGAKFWLITERDRSVTTILLPEEY